MLPPRSMLLLLIVFALNNSHPDAPSAYLPPGSAGIHQLCLIYHGQQSRVPWTAEALLPYVAYVDARGVPQDWLFDSFLLIEFAADNGASLHHFDPNGVHATATDWHWLADAWFRESTGLAGLEGAVAHAGKALSEPDRQVNVIITLPVPLRELTQFGRLDGIDRDLSFAIEPDRQAALAWYMDKVQATFNNGDFAHLNLLGYYWTGESITSADYPIALWTASFLHERNLKFYWIPYFSAAGVHDWRALGFDAMMLQPNYFFDEHVAARRLTLAAKRAQQMRAGVEMEFDGRALSSESFRERYYAYLDAGAKYGWMTNAVLGWYEGGGAVQQLVEQQEIGRPMYDAMYQFLKGTYVPRGATELPPLKVAEGAASNNLALASGGATISGCFDNPAQPELAASQIIDGNTTDYTGTSGFGYFAIPGSFTITLPTAVTIGRIETLLWDLDDRTFTYRIDTSIDNEHWEPAVDKSAGPCSSWQTDSFPPRLTRNIRVTGLSNSTGQSIMQIVELQAFAK